MSKLTDWMESFKANHPTALHEYIASNGKHINSSGLFSCFNGSAHKNGDKNPSCQYHRNTDRFHCHGCGMDGDIFDAVRLTDGVSLPMSVEIVAGRYGIEPPSKGTSSLKASTPPVRKAQGQGVAKAESTAPDEYKTITHPEKNPSAKYFAECQARIEQTDYMQKRGISIETCKRFGIGYDPEWVSQSAPAGVPTTPRIVVPVNPTQYWTRKTTPTDNQKYKLYDKLESVKRGRNPDGTTFEATESTWNIEALRDASGDVFVLESITDALSFEEIGLHAIALNGKGKGKRFISEVQKYRPQCRLIVAMDNEQDADKQQKEIVQGLLSLGLRVVDADRNALFNGAKDANDALVKNRGAFTVSVQTVQANSEEVKTEQEQSRETILKMLNTDIDAMLTEMQESRPMYRTGLDSIDECLGGGFEAGIIIGGALPNLGKTALFQTFAYNFAKQGHPCVFFNLEMRKADLIRRQLSTLTYAIAREQHPDEPHRYALTPKQIRHGWDKRLNGYDFSKEQYEIFQQALSSYREMTGRLFYMERPQRLIPSTEWIEAEADRIADALGTAPIIFLDYLQLVRNDPNATDKQNMDAVAFALGDMWKKYDRPIFCISSLNRENYSEPFSITAFKESGGLEFNADYAFGLQYKGMEYTDEDKNSNERKKRLSKEHSQRLIDGKPITSIRKIEFKLVKSRNGSWGFGDLDFHNHFTFFDGGNLVRNTPTGIKPIKEIYGTAMQDDDPYSFSV